MLTAPAAIDRLGLSAGAHLCTGGSGVVVRRRMGAAALLACLLRLCVSILKAVLHGGAGVFDRRAGGAGGFLGNSR
jgi:hypothetical protein